MNPFGNRGRADHLAVLLDGPPTAPAAVLARRLRAAGGDLSAASTPRAEFRDALRTRLLAVATVQAGQTATPVAAPVRAPSRVPAAFEAAVTWSQGRRAQRGLGLAAGAMASVVAATGIAVAGSRSLPGDPFYDVKRTTEALQLRAADGDVGKGTRHLEIAATRLEEVRGLTLGRDAVSLGAASGAPMAFGGSTSERVADTLAAMDGSTRRGTSLLTDAFRDTGERDSLTIISRFAARQVEGLTALLPELPLAARPRALESLEVVATVRREADLKLAFGTCTTTCDPTTDAPALPLVPTPLPAPTATPTPTPTAPGSTCGCAPSPSAEPQPAPSPTTAPSGEPSPPPTSEPTQEPTPAPSPSPSGGPLPLPTPSLPVPLPTLPVPLPTLPVPSLPPLPGLPRLPVPAGTTLLP